VADEVNRLKAQPGQDLICAGSVQLATTPVEAALVEAALVDGYPLFVYPTVVGRGRRLFPEGTALPQLRLLESRSFRSGVVLVQCQPADR
jgi:dihydrofolate reductase